MAVEFGVVVNNRICDEGNNETNERGVSWFGCSHHLGDPDCKVNIERSFQFQTGRSDCTEHDEEFPYKATKEEKHPSATDAGRKTVEYFKTEFPDLTGRDIVALMGAHRKGTYSRSQQMTEMMMATMRIHRHQPTEIKTESKEM